MIEQEVYKRLDDFTGGLLLPIPSCIIYLTDTLDLHLVDARKLANEWYDNRMKNFHEGRVDLRKLASELNKRFAKTDLGELGYFVRTQLSILDKQGKYINININLSPLKDVPTYKPENESQ